ncbi:hypothetical protein F4809DRAFT_61187 [Biscogniauxia mediterranea]|nr:hypothetical protein F4809DRAFT_61187 [Biscogniauxia mediterranea]
MDHLILPQNPRHPVFKIAMLSAEEYDGGDFHTYPDRQGWSKRTADEWFNIFRTPEPSFVAFLERWLLFGLMSAACSFFQVEFKPSDFIAFTDPVDGVKRPIFTTRHFPALLQQIIDNPLPVRWSSHLHNAGILHICLMKPEEHFDPFVSDHSRKRTLHDFIRAYQTSIRDPRKPGIVLATTIVLESVFGVFPSTIEEIPYVQSGSFENNNGLMWRKLRQEGWCPSDLSRLFNQFSTSTLYFIYQLPRPRPDETHHVIRVWKENKLIQGPPTSPSSAQLCTPYKCVRRQIPDVNYRTKHVEGCEDCDDIVANLDRLCEILEQGQIPLILTMEENDENSEIIFYEYDAKDDNVPYIAISHVWSDGLGNLDRNALPRCQLLRLSNMVRNLPGGYSNMLLFWCDTICVPPDSAKRHRAQNLALGQMRNIYAQAKTVLVLDSWLLNSSMKGEKDTETLMKIFTCPWNTRLWTYQEGALPESLHFQFGDGAYDLDNGMKEASSTCTDLVEKMTIISPLRARYHSLRGFKEEKTPEARLLAIASELGYRSTSVAEDEPLCLAVLLDLNVMEIAETKPSLRMENLWRMMTKVPKSLVFTPLATLDIDGLRWAPATFLKSPSNMARDGSPMKEIWLSHGDTLAQTQHGISLTGAGLLFVRGSGRFNSPLYLQDQHNRGYHLEFVGDREKPRHQDIDLDDRIKCDHLAAIPHYVLEKNDQLEKIFENSKNQVMRAVIVEILKMEGNEIYCRRFSHCSFTQFGSEPSNDMARNCQAWLPTVWKYGVSAVDKSLRVYAGFAKFLPRQQRWYIG